MSARKIEAPLLFVEVLQKVMEALIGRPEGPTNQVIDGNENKAAATWEVASNVLIKFHE